MENKKKKQAGDENARKEKRDENVPQGGRGRRGCVRSVDIKVDRKQAQFRYGRGDGKNQDKKKDGEKENRKTYRVIETIIIDE